MTDSKILREKINECGYKLKYIASILGISHQGLINKLNNESEFKASEIQTLTNLLKLTTREKEKIFFAKKVD
jgi:hypothetical protein